MRQYRDSYDEEFRYAEEIEEKIPDVIKEVEEGDKVEESSSLTKEEYHRLLEENTEARKKFRWFKQEELQQRRPGRILPTNEFLRILKSRVNAWFTDKGGLPGTLGLYVFHEGIKGRCSHNIGEPHYVGYVQVPYMQEYEELHFDRYGVPLNSKYRGWRTVLLNLIEQEILTEEEAHKLFGKPTEGEISQRYRRYLKHLRNLSNKPTS